MSLVIRLLKNSFSDEEWQYLKWHPVFQTELNKRKTSHEDFEYLIEVGELLLKQKEDLHRE